LQLCAQHRCSCNHSPELAVRDFARKVFQPAVRGNDEIFGGAGNDTLLGKGGFDVLFGKGSTNSVLKLKNTNPGTLHYELNFVNTVGVNLNYDNSATASVILTVPGLPTSVGLPIPAGITAAQRDVAFTIQSNKGVTAKPDDKTDDIPVVVQYALSAPAGNCYDNAVVWTTGMPPDGTAAKCIKVSGFAVAMKKNVRFNVNLEFRYKDTDGWGLSAQTAFRAGFAFRSRTVINIGSTFPIVSLQNTSYVGNDSVGLVGAGQQVTAIGGFLLNSTGAGVGGSTVKLYNVAVANCAVTGEVASADTMADGFYFIWKTGGDANQSNGAAPNLPSGVKYFVAVCSQSSPPAFSTSRYMDHKLANKEFDEEDFYVATP
jgi:Ca2+-binding RTX toxin-like protein